MTSAIEEELREFATRLLERRGSLVEWPAAEADGVAVLPADVARAVRADQETVRLTERPGGDGLCVNLGTDFLDVAGELLQAEPRIGAFTIPELYLKRGALDEAVQQTFSWLNVKVRVRDTRADRVEYHTWWFHAAMASDDRWETRFAVSLNAASGAEIDLPDPLDLWELKPRHGDLPPPATCTRASAVAQARLVALAGDFLARMDARLDRDRKRLRDYYTALLRETRSKKPRGAAKPDPEKLAAKERAVQLELRRKLVELEERYAVQARLRPVVLLRTAMPVLAVDLVVFRKQWQKRYTVYWNPLLKQFEPIACSRCGSGAFTLAFSNETVDPLCPGCAKGERTPGCSFS